MKKRVPKRWTTRHRVIFGVIGVVLCVWQWCVTQPVFSAETQVSVSHQHTSPDESPDTIVADVLSVTVAGEPNSYRFSVEVASPDTGCEQYADWWEVVTDDGTLVYRRILAHSHVEEQPFIRSGGPVAIPAETVVIIRAHMQPGGYGGNALKGRVLDGFNNLELAGDFAADVETTPPQPSECAF